MKLKIIFLCLYLLNTYCLAQGGLSTPSLPAQERIPEQITWKIIDTFPHNATASTQGLVYNAGMIYESTGLFGQSSLHKKSLTTGATEKFINLSSRDFGEGVTLFEDKLYQITWRSGTGYIYDKELLIQEDQFHYQGEGWGLTNDGKHLIMSDGTAKLSFLDPVTFKKIKSLAVSDQYGPVMQLNELEYFDGAIFANVLYKNKVARIDPNNGHVTGWIDFQPLVDTHLSAPSDAIKSHAMNGIAWDSSTRTLFVTGKNWSKLFAISLLKKTIP